MSILPKRGVIAAAITALGLALLLSFRTPDKPVQTLPGSGTLGGDGTNGGGTGGTGGTVSNPGGGTTPTPAPQGGGTANGTVTGPVVQTRFGPVQIQISFSNGSIADVQALQLPNDRQRSAQISSYVAPILRQEVLTAQGAQIDLISGATYTSYAYEQSVQAILDQANG
jgi:uncharacterized protein with FMN-binding domain